MTRNHNQLPPIKDLSRHNAARSGGDVAFEDPNQSVTWNTFERESCRAANAFRAYAGRGDRIAYYCESSVDHTILFNGGMKAGCTVTNLHTNTSPQNLRYCLNEIRPTVVVVDEDLSGEFFECADADALQSVSAIVTIGEAQSSEAIGMASFLDGADETDPDVLVEEDDLLVIGWTSGSTGRPKGWCHTNRTMYLKGMELGSRPGFDRTGTMLLVNKPSFLVWFSLYTKAVLGGEATYYLPDWDATRWLDLVEAKGITQSTLVPTMWREVLDRDHEARDLSSLHSIVSTGEKLSPTTLRALRSHICDNVSQTYGSTEIHSTVLYNDELTEDRIESVGKPQAGTELRIIEPDGTPDDVKPRGETGEIIVKSPDAPAWVWGDTEKTHQQFRDGWWYSRDLGYRDDDGFLYIEGRADFMIKSKGVKIVPAPIEAALNDHDNVENAIVVGTPDEEFGQKVTAIVRAVDDELSADDLDEWCLEHDGVANHERPRSYQFVDEIDRTPSGKLDRISTVERIGMRIGSSE